MKKFSELVTVSSEVFMAAIIQIVSFIIMTPSAISASWSPKIGAECYTESLIPAQQTTQFNAIYI
jgi:hypothetical protein